MATEVQTAVPALRVTKGVDPEAARTTWELRILCHHCPVTWSKEPTLPSRILSKTSRKSITGSGPEIQLLCQSKTTHLGLEAAAKLSLARTPTSYSLWAKGASLRIHTNSSKCTISNSSSIVFMDMEALVEVQWGNQTLESQGHLTERCTEATLGRPTLTKEAMVSPEVAILTTTIRA